MGKVLMSLEQAKSVAQMMWEVQGLTLVKIAQNMGKSVRCITNWRDDGKWVKSGEDAGKLQELTKQRFLDQLAEQGMPSERAAKLLIEGMTRPMTDQISEVDSETGKQKVIFKGNKDYKTRHKYMHDYLLTAGVVGGSEKQAGPGQGGSINIQVNIPEKR